MNKPSFKQGIISIIRKRKYPLYLIVYLLIAYLPVSSFQFALKNDAFIYNFPNKYFFSESLKNGIIPFWNPYLNYGFPLYADPGFAWWHPITWLFGLIGYNPYTFTVEVLVYLYIAGLGMYWLGRQFNLSIPTSFVMGAMFSCSGFFVGNLQHINFITCAAFLPWLVGCWHRLQEKPSIRRVFLMSVVTYLIFTGGHPAIPIATVYFLIILSIIYLIQKKDFEHIASFIKWNGMYLFICLLLMLLPLVAWLHLMPYYVRSEVINQHDNTHLGFTLNSYLSFLSPVAVIKNNQLFNTDISMRNAYFSLLGFIGFIVSVCVLKHFVQKLFFTLGCIMLLFAAGGLIKEFLFTYLPFLHYIRANGEFRVFSIFSFIIVSGFSFNNLDKSLRIKKNLFQLLIFFGCFFLFILSITTFFYQQSLPIFFYRNHSIAFIIKDFLQRVTFPQTIFWASFACLSIIIFGIANAKKKLPSSGFYIIILIDLIINLWITLPVTGVGSTSVSYLQTKLNRFPKGFPIPSLKNKPIPPLITDEDEKKLGNQFWYNKEILHKSISYPSSLINTFNFLNSKDSLWIKDKPFLYLKNASGEIFIKKFMPTYITIHTNIASNDTLILLQNNYPGWRAWSNGRRCKISPFHNTFLQIPVAKKDTIITIKFSPF